MGKHFQHLFFATNPLKHVSYHFRFWDPNLTPLFAQVYTLYICETSVPAWMSVMHSLSGCHGMRRWHLAQFPSFTRPYAKCAIATKRWRLGSCAVSCAAIIRYLHSGSGATDCATGTFGLLQCFSFSFAAKLISFLRVGRHQAVQQVLLQLVGELFFTWALTSVSLP